MQVLEKRVERYDLLRSLECAPAEITFGLMENGEVDNVNKDLLK